jgi:3-hydroxyacyl-CoA dehydrogenase
MSKAAAKLVEVGNIEDDLGRVAECDWVIEAIVEKIELKHALYEKLEACGGPGRRCRRTPRPFRWTADRGAQRGFPPRFPHHPFLQPAALHAPAGCGRARERSRAGRAVSDFADRAMGKTVVRAKDTPGFLANRVGTYWLQAAINAAFDLGVSVEDADAIGGKPMGVPKTGIFGLVDLVGIDLMPYLKASLTARCPRMIPIRRLPGPSADPEDDRDGYTGRKGKGGFLSHQPRGRKGQGSDRSGHRRLSQGGKPVSIAAQGSARADRHAGQGGGLCLGGAGADAGLCCGAGRRGGG